MQHRDTGGGEIGSGGRHRAVDRDRPLRTAEHQQNPGVGVESEMLPGLFAHGGPVHAGDGRPQWHADHLGATQTGSRHRGEHPSGGARADPIGQSGAGVGLVDDDRHRSRTPATAPRRQIGRDGDITAESNHHVGAGIIEHGSGHQSQRITPVGHQSALQSARGAQCSDSQRRIQCDQGIGNGHRRFNMPGGATAGQHDRQCVCVTGARFAVDPRPAHP